MRRIKALCNLLERLREHRGSCSTSETTHKLIYDLEESVLRDLQSLTQKELDQC